jgi:two-component system sensor histidine kinase AlgZ
MQDSRLLSTLGESTRPNRSGGVPEPSLLARGSDSSTPLFDPCQASVVLRTLVAVQSVLAVVLLFQAASARDWVLQFAVMTAGTLPATLLWLFLCCTVLRKRPVQQWTRIRHQLLTPVLLGVLCGWVACAVLSGLMLIEHPRWLASALASGMLSGSLVILLVWRNKALQPSDSQARLKELQARIRPHFLFNTLNSAIALVRAEPAKAETLLEDLSELFRAAMQDHQSTSTLAQELELAERYLAIEQVRFGTRLRITWQLDPQAATARLPALILQPLVENAVRHGVEPSAEGADIHITTQRSATQVLIDITNTMPSGAGPAGHGMALANVRERLMLMHDLECRFRHTQSGGIFQVRLEVPA